MSTQPIDYDALAKQAGAVSSAPDYDAMAKQAGAISSTPTPQPKAEDAGFLSKAWRVINTPLADLAGGDGTTKRAILQAVGQSLGIDLSPENLAYQAQRTDTKHPAVQGIRAFLAGSAGDTADMAAGFTSPVALGTAAIGTAAKGAGAAAKVAKVVAPLVGAGFAAKGAKDVVDAGTSNTPEAWQQRLQGGAMVAGGAAGVKEFAGDVPSPRGIMADRMAQTPTGEQFTRQQVLDAAREKGVNLDLAQATDAPIAHGIKKGTEHTLGGGVSYDANMTKNVDALEKWAHSTADQYSPEPAPREQVGALLQQALKDDLQRRKAIASQSFQDLDSRVGGNIVDGTNSIEATARQIVDENKDYYAKHPELKPKQAWTILENLAERPKVNTVNQGATAPGLMDVNGQPQYAAGTITKQPAPQHVFNWNELHQLRSDLMDFYRNNPDVVKGRSEAWLQQMVGKIDETMTGAAAHLSPADQAQFRQANQVWEGIKGTYDNPRSPYYQAVRSMTPSNLPASLANSPELAKQVRATLGSLEGPFQRQFVENILNNKTGQMDLKNLNNRLSNVRDDVLTSMLGDDGARQLRMLGKVASKVTADSNPSGTAKTAVRTAEIANFVHNPVVGAAEMGTTYGTGKAMTNSRLVDYLTNRKKP